MASAGGEDTGATSPSSIDKRRSKLGYQRISVACNHCRRRKIRCALAEGDDQGRCSNCIKLKKECVFTPVESNSGSESRAQPKLGLSTTTSSIMTPSPTSVTTQSHEGDDRDRDRDPHRIATVPSNVPIEDQTSLGPSSAISAPSTGSMNAPEYGYHTGPNAPGRADWQSRSFPVPGQPYEEHNWRLQEGATVDTLGQVPSSSQPATYGAPPNYAFLAQQQQQQQHHAHDHQQYGQPLRSVSTSWADVERSQPTFAYGNTMAVPATHPPGMIFGHSYSGADPHHLQVTSPAQHAPVPPGFAPNYAPQPQHTQWHPYAHPSQYVQSGRHDSADGAWTQGAQPAQSMDPNYHLQQDQPNPYKRGSNPPG